MSATVTTNIFCDICHNWDPDVFVSGVMTAEIATARKIAKRRGWIYKKVDGQMKDICPKCQKEE